MEKHFTMTRHSGEQTGISTFDKLCSLDGMTSDAKNCQTETYYKQMGFMSLQTLKLMDRTHNIITFLSTKEQKINVSKAFHTSCYT